MDFNSRFYLIYFKNIILVFKQYKNILMRYFIFAFVTVSLRNPVCILYLTAHLHLAIYISIAPWPHVAYDDLIGQCSSRVPSNQSLT